MESNLELNNKLTISVEEASLLSGIGTNTIYRMIHLTMVWSVI